MIRMAGGDGWAAPFLQFELIRKFLLLVRQMHECDVLLAQMRPRAMSALWSPSGAKRTSNAHHEMLALSHAGDAREAVADNNFRKTLHRLGWRGNALRFQFSRGIDANECFEMAFEKELAPGKYLRVYFAEHYSVDQRRLIRRARLKDRWRKQHNGIRAA
jgi:hypothetical protein